MCSLLVMEKVQAALTRRRLLGMAGMAGAAAVLAPMGRTRSALLQATPGAGGVASPVASPTAPITFCGASTLLDLSHTHGPDFPMYPGAQQMQINVLVTLDQGFYKNELILD